MMVSLTGCFLLIRLLIILKIPVVLESKYVKDLHPYIANFSQIHSLLVGRRAYLEDFNFLQRNIIMDVKPHRYVMQDRDEWNIDNCIKFIETHSLIPDDCQSILGDECEGATFKSIETKWHGLQLGICHPTPNCTFQDFDQSYQCGNAKYVLYHEYTFDIPYVVFVPVKRNNKVTWTAILEYNEEDLSKYQSPGSFSLKSHMQQSSYYIKQLFDRSLPDDVKYETQIQQTECVESLPFYDADGFYHENIAYLNHDWKRMCFSLAPQGSYCDSLWWVDDYFDKTTLVKALLEEIPWYIVYHDWNSLKQSIKDQVKTDCEIENDIHLRWNVTHCYQGDFKCMYGPFPCSDSANRVSKCLDVEEHFTSPVTFHAVKVVRDVVKAILPYIKTIFTTVLGIIVDVFNSVLVQLGLVFMLLTTASILVMVIKFGLRYLDSSLILLTLTLLLSTLGIDLKNSYFISCILVLTASKYSKVLERYVKEN
ncbi:spike protein [Lodeiro virus]|uniref:spike protein n=1 Tax=Lodeiro virus TaxID=1911102 RepID=UPI0008DB3B48|nr:spike protein [Lodeiro virus]AOY34454.1 spike protein [Lodeiro virus]